MPLLQAEGRGLAQGAGAWFPPEQPLIPPLALPPGPCAGLRPTPAPVRPRRQSLRGLTISVPWAAGRLAVLPVPRVEPGRPITRDLHVRRKPSCRPGFRTLRHGPL